jgi:hypothetical protein
MKKIFVLSVFTSVAMICGCQKKDSAAGEQLTQSKTELGRREEALADRLNSLEEKLNRLDQKVNQLAEKEKPTVNARASSGYDQGQTSDPAQIQAEQQKMIQQFTAMISRASQETVGDPTRQGRTAQRQLGPEDLQRQWQDKMKMSGKAVFPAAQAASPTPSPAIETTSPSSSPAPE